MKWLAAALVLLLCACASRPNAVLPPLPAMPAPPPLGEPADLFGLSDGQLRAEFGAPTFARRENGSEMWRYDKGPCRVFFFLYADGNAMSVRHVETAPHGKDAAADPSCLSALRGKG